MDPKNEFKNHWLLDPEVTYFNHGSFGACPISVLDKQEELRRRLERQPILFLDREHEPMMDHARASLGDLLGCDPADLAFVTNATMGANTVLRSARFSPGDQLLVTDHAYAACKNALDFAAKQWGAKVVSAEIPFPCPSDQMIIEAVTAKVTPKTKLALLDHITSPTALILPIHELVKVLEKKGVAVLVDGAHAPGMVELDIDEIGASYYTGNCHKWLCGPKGAGFLHVRKDRQANVHPLSISHGYCGSDRGRGRFRVEFDWTGTMDPTPFLCVPHAVEFLDSLMEGGLSALMKQNHDKVVTARKVICRALGMELPCPDFMIGSMASFILPENLSPQADPKLRHDSFQMMLWNNFKIEVPVMRRFYSPERILRISAQVYNSPGEYKRLADILKKHI